MDDVPDARVEYWPWLRYLLNDWKPEAAKGDSLRFWMLSRTSGM